MQDDAKSDIDFQPETKGFSYSSDPAEKKRKVNTFFALFIGVPLIILIFAIFFVILNYFKIISLSNFNANLFSWLPVKQVAITEDANNPPEDNTTYSNETKSWTTTGTLYGYKEEIIQLKSEGEIFEFKFTQNTSFSISNQNIQSPSESAETNDFYHTLYDLEKKENLGKRIEVNYDKDKNILIMYLFE